MASCVYAHTTLQQVSQRLQRSPWVLRYHILSCCIPTCMDHLSGLLHGFLPRFYLPSPACACASIPDTVITCLVCTGAPHDLPDWARPGNGAAKQADGLPRKRQKAAAAAVTFPELAALPPPLTHGPSQLSATGQPKLPGVMAKRPYKKRQPIASTSLQAHLAASRLSSGLHAEVQHRPKLLRSMHSHGLSTAAQCGLVCRAAHAGSEPMGTLCWLGQSCTQAHRALRI